MKVYQQSVFERWPLEDCSVQAIITSPPYYSLRKYDIPDVIIGGDKDCKHELRSYEWNQHSGRHMEINSKDAVLSHHPNIPDMKLKASFCLHCNAWQGQYGLEPDFKSYVSHSLLWAKEAWRVLRDDGVFFLNIADSYNSTPIGKQVDQKRMSAHGEFSYDHKKTLQKDYPSKCLLCIPERMMLGLIDAGWVLRNKIIWYKKNAMPESVTDRFSKKYEFVYMFVKQPKYYFNLDAVLEPYTEPMNRWGGEKLKRKKEICDKCDGKGHWYDYNHSGEMDYYHECNQCHSSGFIFVESQWDKETNQATYRDRNMRPNANGKNPGDVWEIMTQPSPEKHFAMWPEKLVERMILCSTKAGDVVLDPFAGSCTTGKVAISLQREFVGIDLGYEEIGKRRTSNVQINILV